MKEYQLAVVYVMTRPEMLRHAQQMVAQNIGQFPPGAHEWRWVGDELWLKITSPIGEIDGQFGLVHLGYIVVPGEIEEEVK